MRHFTLFIFCILTKTTFCQLLLETKEEDELFKPLITTSAMTSSLNKSRFIKINAGEQSLGFDYYKGPSNGTFVKYSFWNLGVKAKPTEGIAAVFSNGQFSPGVTLSGSVTQVKILDKTKTKPENYFLDWGSLSFNYSVNKYQLYRPDTTFKNQLYSVTFQGFALSGNYNMLLNSKVLVSLKLGYARKNNFNDLDAVEVRDIKTIIDTSTNTTRQASATKTARQGKYSEFDAYPIGISFTKLTYDDPTLGKAYSFGYSFYMNALPSNFDKPKTNVGFILYLAQMNNGISTPIIGLNFQFSDFFDVKKTNNGLIKRFGIGITSNIPIL